MKKDTNKVEQDQVCRLLSHDRLKGDPGKKKIHVETNKTKFGENHSSEARGAHTAEVKMTSNKPSMHYTGKGTLQS